MTNRLERLPREEMGFACVDHHRALRWGYCETIFYPRETTEQAVEIAERMVAYGHENIVATKAREETLEAL